MTTPTPTPDLDPTADLPAHADPFTVLAQYAEGIANTLRQRARELAAAHPEPDARRSLWARHLLIEARIRAEAAMSELASDLLGIAEAVDFYDLNQLRKRADLLAEDACRNVEAFEDELARRELA